MTAEEAGRLRAVLETIRETLPQARLGSHEGPPLPRAACEAASQAVRVVCDAVQVSGRQAHVREETSFGPALLAEAPLAAAFRALHTHLTLDIKRCLGGDEGLSSLAEIRRDESVPDFLGLAGMPFTEVAHSGVIRSLLDPATAPTVAPLLLLSLAEALFESEPTERSAWTSCLQAAFGPGASGNIAVRTEVPVGTDVETTGRIDILVSGPGFALAIENKTQSFEHDGQTRTYARWLDRNYRSALRAGIFLTVGAERAESSMFRPLSYVGLLGQLVKVRRCRHGATRQEELLLDSYIKTVAASLVGRHIAILSR